MTAVKSVENVSHKDNVAAVAKTKLSKATTDAHNTDIQHKNWTLQPTSSSSSSP